MLDSLYCRGILCLTGDWLTLNESDCDGKGNYIGSKLKIVLWQF